MEIYRVSWVFVVLICGCGSSPASNTGASAGSSSGIGGGAGNTTNSADATSCTGQEAVCPTLAFGLCTEVQMAPGVCVDWSKSGATRCTSPLDCPATNPTSNLGAAASTARAICVKATHVEYTTTGSTADAGYCAATQNVTDSSGVLDCSTDPCGSTGYCSYVRNKANATVVECAWSI